MSTVRVTNLKNKTVSIDVAFDKDRQLRVALPPNGSKDTTIASWDEFKNNAQILALRDPARPGGAVISLTNGTGMSVADPGDDGAISVADSGVVAMVSAGAEARTLAIPTFVGQWLVLVADTHNGDIVVTSAQAINQAGETVMTFGADGESISLVAITIAGARRWRVVANDGVALS